VEKTNKQTTQTNGFLSDDTKLVNLKKFQETKTNTTTTTKKYYYEYRKRKPERGGGRRIGQRIEPERKIARDGCRQDNDTCSKKRREEKRRASTYCSTHPPISGESSGRRTTEEEEEEGGSNSSSFAAPAGVKAKLRRKASPVVCSERVAIVSVRPVPRPRPQLVPGTQYLLLLIN
jgi:hypothetical protein